MIYLKTLKGIALSFMAASLLSGCLSNTGTSGDGNVDPRLTQDEPEFFSESGALACAGGAILGVLAGALVCDGDNKLACAIGGGLAGCGVGMGANYILDRVRADNHNLETQLDATAKEVADHNKSIKDLNARAQKLVEEGKAEQQKLEQQLTRGEISKDKYAEKARSLDGNIAYLQNAVQKHKEELANYQTAREALISKKDKKGKVTQVKLSEADKKQLADLDKQIAFYQSEIAALEKTEADYAQVRSSYIINSEEDA